MNSNADFYRLISFLLTSARGCIDEPKMYGPFRLVDAGKRLIDILDERGLADVFLKQIRTKLDETEGIDIGDEERFIKSLDDLILAMVKQVEKW